MSDNFREECIKLQNDTETQIRQMLDDYQYQDILDSIKDNSRKIREKHGTPRGLECFYKTYINCPLVKKDRLLTTKKRLIEKKKRTIHTQYKWTLFNIAHKYKCIMIILTHTRNIIKYETSFVSIP